MEKTDIQVLLLTLLSSVKRIETALHRIDSKEKENEPDHISLKIDDEQLSKLLEDLHCLYSGDNTEDRVTLTEDSIAYISYLANAITLEGFQEDYEFDINQSLSSIFNTLNGNQVDCSYDVQRLDDTKINYPIEIFECRDENQRKRYYQKAIEEINVVLSKVSGNYNQSFISSILNILEKYFVYAPVSNKNRDISLFDHCRMSAAVSACIKYYMDEKQEDGEIPKEQSARWICEHAADFYRENTFLLYSLDISGIQNFIYTISTKGALKALRARSFYLELMIEHIIDELFQMTGLTRANLMYSGGGHCYIIAPNTNFFKEKSAEFEKQINSFFMEKYGVLLYVAGGYSEFSADTLRNHPQGSYSQIFINVSQNISKKKSCRYSAQEIIALNKKSNKGDRECSVCRKTDHLDSNNRCSTCAAINDFSKNILDDMYFVVLDQKKSTHLDLIAKGVALPFDRILISVGKLKELELLKNDSAFIRAYSKNTLNEKEYISTKFWIGDYSPKSDFNRYSTMNFEEFSKNAKGINRIAVLRADVDNLGHTFVFGLKDNVSLSKSAMLSRELSLFFKFYLNTILNHPMSDLFGKNKNLNYKPNVAIVYSGGDDLFLVGAWDDIIDVAIDIHRELERFTSGSLSISAGIGIYEHSYPINVIAKEVEHLESCSKNCEGKNAITLFDRTNSYHWSEFIAGVVGEKFVLIRDFFEKSEERGKNFMYHLLQYMRNIEEADYSGNKKLTETKKIEHRMNIPRFLYLFARLAPDEKKNPQYYQQYQEFSKKMYFWILNEKDRREAVMAMYLYAYLTRETKGDNDE